MLSYKLEWYICPVKCERGLIKTGGSEALVFPKRRFTDVDYRAHFQPLLHCRSTKSERFVRGSASGLWPRLSSQVAPDKRNKTHKRREANTIMSRPIIMLKTQHRSCRVLDDNSLVWPVWKGMVVSELTQQLNKSSLNPAPVSLSHSSLVIQCGINVNDASEVQLFTFSTKM